MYTEEEHKENLIRLGVDDYSSMVGKAVYYIRKSYGEHMVLAWDGEWFLLSLEGEKFLCSPFHVVPIV